MFGPPETRIRRRLVTNKQYMYMYMFVYMQYYHTCTSIVKLKKKKTALYPGTGYEVKVIQYLLVSKA